MRLIRLLLAASLLVHGLAACSMFKREEDTADPPAELVTFKSEIGIDELWSRSIGDGAGGQMLNLVIAHDGERLFVADHKGVVTALQAADGRVLWEHNTGAGISAGPGVGDGLVLLGTSDGRLLALDAADGGERWQAQLSSEILSVPAAAGGLTVAQTVDGRVFGLSSGSGARRWIFTRPEPLLTLRGSSSPLIVGNRVYVGLASGRLSAIDASDGRPQWEARVGVPSGRSDLERLTDIDANLLLRDDTLYTVTYQGRIAAISRYDGNLLWVREMSSYTGMSADSDQIYVSDDKGAVWALDRNNGASLWKQDKLFARGVTAPAVLDDAVIVADAQGYVHWLARDDGRFIARVRHSGAAIRSAPLAAAGRLFILDAKGGLSAYRGGPE